MGGARCRRVGGGGRGGGGRANQHVHTHPGPCRLNRWRLRHALRYSLADADTFTGLGVSCSRLTMWKKDTKRETGSRSCKTKRTLACDNTGGGG